MTSFARRRDALRRLLIDQALPALLVTEERNVAYLTGFTGDSSYLLITRDREVILSDRRYEQQLQEECPGVEVAIRGPGSPMPAFAASVIGKLALPAVAIEADSVTYSFYEKFHSLLPAGKLTVTRGLVESLREIKDESEVATIREAIRVAEQALAAVRQGLDPGMSEKQVADELEYRIRRSGGTCGAFPAIIGVGPRAALPHGRPTEDMRLQDADFVLIDWGARYAGYHSDLTRVLVTGKLSPQLEKVYGVVLAAQEAAIHAIRPGVLMKDVDAAARKVIADAGYGEAFGHALGHGIGLAVHEQPRLGPDQARPLAAGMVVTVEPGIYLPGWGGVRIEDDVLVTLEGCEVLTHWPKAWEECMVR
jgi:Xaa-Pro aminopeptidase